MTMIDLSIPLTEERWAPRILRNRIRHSGHRQNLLLLLLGFRLRPRHLRTGVAWANDEIRLSTHGTTHVDAPWHYGPTSEGRPARTIDQVPLDWFFGPGVCLDLTHREDGEAITKDDIESALDAIGHALAPGEIVLIRTGNDRYYGTRDYFDKGTGMSGEATRYILEQGVKVCGIDSWGWDRPLAQLAQEARKSGRPDVFWQGHYVGIDIEYCHIERLTNLDKLPPTGFTVSAFPLKVEGGSAGPARVVAIVSEEPAKEKAR